MGEFLLKMTGIHLSWVLTDGSLLQCGDKEKQFDTQKAQGLEHLYAALLILIRATDLTRLRRVTLKYSSVLSTALHSLFDNL